jgi:hypothetical protein
VVVDPADTHMLGIDVPREIMVKAHTWLVCGLVLSLNAVSTPAPSYAAGCGSTLPVPVRHVTGVPPHRSWPLPNNAQRQWRPIAVDRRYVLMAWQASARRDSAQPTRMALVRIGSRVLTSIPAGAYPHGTILGKWQMEWPWIVGIAGSQSLPGPPSWELWAGNVQTGAASILDRAARPSAPPSGPAPDFSLERGRVAWIYGAVVRPAVDLGNQLEYRVALDTLATHTRRFLTPLSPVVYGRITLGGSRVVWEQQTPLPAQRRAPYSLIDLRSYDLRSGQTLQLTHSTLRAGSSLLPSLWGNLLLFEHGASIWSGGSIVLVDLAAHVAGGGPAWWQMYQYHVLSPHGTYPALAGGLATWGSNVLSNLATSTVWTFPVREHGPPGWGVTMLGGGNALMTRPGFGYAVWQVSGACVGSTGS